MTESPKPTKQIVTTVQLSRPFLTDDEIAHLQSKTIDDPLSYNQRKSQMFQTLFTICKNLKFPLKTLETSMLYYQKYYLFNKFDSDSIYTVALTSLFLSTKNEDTIKRLRDIIGLSNNIRGIENSTENVELQRKKILNTEKCLLEVISFDFLTYHTDEILIKIAKKLKIGYELTYLCWIICFDSFQTDVALKVPPHCIALAIVIIATKLNVPSLTEKPHFNKEDIDVKQLKINPQDFNVPERLLNSALFGLLDFYINFYNYSHLAGYFDKQQDFVDIKVQFAKYRLFDEAPKSELEKDEYFRLKDYSISKEGSARYMLGNKRRRFNKELED